jgi:hypothetical protein
MTFTRHVIPRALLMALTAGCAAASGGRNASVCSTTIDSVTQTIVADSSLAVGVLVGRVLAAPGDHPLEYAHVSDGHQIGTIVGHDGSFRLTDLASDSVHIVVRYIGYHTLVVAARMPSSVGGRTDLHLRPNGCPIVS